MPRVTEPFPIFYDDDGTPLENGMIYIGAAGDDPRVTPLQVYWDEAYTEEAEQPIRTLNGRPAYQGAPANIYITGETYSILVANRFGTPVTADQNAMAGSDSGASNIVLTLEQFGGAADYVSPSNRGTDNTAALALALAEVNRYAPVNARWPRVPRIELALGAYYFASKIDLKVACYLRGQGGGHDDFNGGTRFVFPTGVQGITVNNSDTVNGGVESPTTSALGTVIEGIQIESEGGGTGWNTAAALDYAGVTVSAANNTYGLWVRTACTIRDVVTKGWKGNGVQIIAVAGGSGGLRGNANGVLVDRLTVRENDSGTASQGHGFFVCGNDANTCDLRSVQVRHAGLMGICEVGTLGNTWINPRVDDWGRVARTGALPMFLGSFLGGINYVLIDITPGIGAATTPGTNAAVWYPLETAGAASALFPAWSASANYVCMLPMLFGGQSNSSQVFNPYIETGFPGDAGGSTTEPGTGVVVYGGSAVFTRRTRHARGTTGSGSSATVSQTGFGSFYQSGPGTSEFTNYGAYAASRIGAKPGEIWAGRTQRDSEADYAMRFNAAGEIIMDRGGTQNIIRISTPITNRQFGTGANVPYVVTFPAFALTDPTDSGNDRRLSCGTAPPTTGARARGDRVWNINPGAGRPDYWECITAGTPGTWIGVNVMPFQSGAASSSLTGTTAETVLATMTLPGGTLGPNGSIEIDALWSMNANANAKTLRARFGGISGPVFGAATATASSLASRMSAIIQNRNNVSSQIANACSNFVNATVAHNTGTVNTAVDQTIVITGQLGVGTDNMALEGYLVRICPGA